MAHWWPSANQKESEAERWKNEKSVHARQVLIARSCYNQKHLNHSTIKQNKLHWLSGSDTFSHYVSVGPLIIQCAYTFSTKNTLFISMYESKNFKIENLSRALAGGDVDGVSGGNWPPPDLPWKYNFKIKIKTYCAPLVSSPSYVRVIVYAWVPMRQCWRFVYRNISLFQYRNAGVYLCEMHANNRCTLYSILYDSPTIICINC